ncbi:MAG: glycosyltransferase family 2 protein [Candidatus Shapirobacteria bacterium]
MILVSFITPTLNAGKVLKDCLQSISLQTIKDYEIIIADGGSTDNTLIVAKNFKAKIFKNPLKTGEAGKAVGIRHAKGKYLVFLDSDNLLPSKNWLKKMLLPLQKDPQIIGSEPISFTYRRDAGFTERYSALIGANDPYAYISGIYDRYSYLSGKWTGLKIETQDFPNYLKIKLNPNELLPTIGANGAIFRHDFLKNYFKGDYFFDIDIITSVIHQTHQPLYFAKVKVGIIHTFCESSIKKFIRKQKRRIVDFYQFQNIRQFNWQKNNRSATVKFSLYTITLIPPIFDSFRGYLKKPDFAWFFHPLACLISFFVYFSATLKNVIGQKNIIDRSHWQQ